MEPPYYGAARVAVVYALTQIAIGLAIAHVLWALFYLTGSMVWGREPVAEASSGRAMLFLVVATASGLAIYGLEGIGLGLAGFMTPAGWYFATVLNGALLVLLTPRELRAQWWKTRLAVVRNAIASPAIVAYLAMLVLCTHAALPDYSDDGVRYHLAYAYEWYHTGRIFADHHFRFPYYTFNTEVIYAWLFVLRIGRYIPFLNWMTGTNAVLAIYGLIATVDESRQRLRSPLAQGAASVVYAIVPLSMVIAAVFFRWVDTAMPDATSSMCFAAATASIVLVIYGAAPELLFGCALSTAYLAGMKPTYVLLVPLFGVFILLAGRYAHVARRTVAACLALMCALSLPWYIRNFVADGDPLPPFLHMALGRPDPDISRADIEGMAADLRPENLSLRSVEEYPLRLFRRADTSEFREAGVSAVVLSLYAILLVAVTLVFKTQKSRADVGLLALLWITLGGCLYLFATSILARYALLIYPTIAASAGCLILYAASASRYGILIAPAIAVCLTVPSRSAAPFTTQFSDLAYNSLAKVMPNDQSALERQLNGYLEAEPLLNQQRWGSSPDRNVLLVNADIQYYIELYGGEPFGDWMGATRYSDLAMAIDEQRARAYVDGNHIVAAVIRVGNGALVKPEVESLREQLLQDGFREISSSDADYVVLVRASR